jgi:hypothetical protein
VAVAAAAVLVGATCGAGIVLLPGSEAAHHMSRTLLQGVSFAQEGAATWRDVAFSLASECFLVFPAPTIDNGPYMLTPGISVGILMLAIGLSKRARTGGLLVGAALFALGMLGPSGPLYPVLQIVFPMASLLRVPLRMAIPCTFLLSLAAAKGLQQVRWRDQGAAVGLVWVLFLMVHLEHGTLKYVPPAMLDTADLHPYAAHRVAMDFGSVPFGMINAGLVENVQSLSVYDAVVPAAYFEAMFASQIGSLHDTAKVKQAITNGNMLPIPKPRLPLMRAFDLATLVRHVEHGYAFDSLPHPAGRFFCVPHVVVVPKPEDRWAMAASAAWDPHNVAVVAEPVALSDTDAQSTIAVQSDTPDRQVLQVTASGPVLQVTSSCVYPGWSVTVDGQAQPLVQADLALRAVVVPAGTHVVEWRYRPTTLPYAMVAVPFGLLLIVGIGCWPADKRPTP